MKIVKLLFAKERNYTFNTILLLFILTALSGSSVKVKPSIIIPSHPNMQYMGRVVFNHPDTVDIWWVGTAITANFTGTSVKMIMSNPNEVTHYFNIIIDDTLSVLALPAFSIDAVYTLASGLNNKAHTVKIIKRDSPWNNQVFKGLILDAGGELLSPAAAPVRKIEFYGDSITQGCQSDVPPDSADNGNFLYDNNYNSYAAITARAFNAACMCTAISGISLTPYKVRSNLPSIFDRIYGSIKAPLWDFAQWQADVVVVNLGENDHPFPQNFSSAYISFVQKIRNKYPAAQIFLLTGPMSAGTNSKIIKAIDKAVKTVNVKGDKKVYAYHFIKNDSHRWHPRIADHQSCAKELIAKIKIVIWGDAVTGGVQ
jgi:lysophospholipase L1-like esterase